MLPTLFDYLVQIEKHEDEDDRQDSLLIKLFWARIMNPVIFPYINVNWKNALNEDTLLQIFNLQVDLGGQYSLSLLLNREISHFSYLISY